MKKIFILIMALEGVLMAASLSEIEVQEVKVPIVFEQEKYLPIVSMQLVFTGAGHLSSHKDGLADMSAKLLNEGTKALGSVGFATKLDAHAVELSAGVGRESFVIEVSALKSEFSYAVERLVELLSDPNYTEEALQQIKHQKLGWLAQKKSDFNYVAATQLRATLFQGSALAKPYDGTPQSVTQMQLTDIQRFIKNHLGYNNLIVVVGGDIELNSAKQYIQKISKLLPRTETKQAEKIVASDKRERVMIEEETEQAYIFFGAPFDYSYQAKDQYKAKIAEYLLGGGGFGSRLMDEIRVKRGLTYGVYASLRRTKSVSYLSGYLQTKLATQEEAIGLIQEVVDRFVKEGITQKELDDTKKFLLGSEPLRTETLSQRLGRTYNDYYYGRPLDFAKRELQKIAEVTLEEMNRFIQSHEELSKLTFSIVTHKSLNSD